MVGAEGTTRRAADRAAEQLPSCWPTRESTTSTRSSTTTSRSSRCTSPWGSRPPTRCARPVPDRRGSSPRRARSRRCRSRDPDASTPRPHGLGQRGLPTSRPSDCRPNLRPARLTIASPVLTRKGANNAFSASATQADGSPGGSSRLLTGPILLALASGCVVTRPRDHRGHSLAHSFATAALTGCAPARTAAPSPPTRRPPAAVATRTGPGRVVQPTRAPRDGSRSPGRGARQDAGSAARPRTTGRAADRAPPVPRRSSVPSPSVIPPPSGDYPIDLATALRLADVVNPTITGRGVDPRGPGPAADGQTLLGPVAQRRRELPRAQRRPAAVLGQDPQPLGAVALRRRRVPTPSRPSRSRSRA